MFKHVWLCKRKGKNEKTKKFEIEKGHKESRKKEDFSSATRMEIKKVEAISWKFRSNLFRIRMET